MSFTLSKRSLSKLTGVHEDLVRVVRRAITITDVDFTVLEGIRTLERQRRLLDIGATTTLNSRHLTGHAVDLGAWVDHKVRWDWPLYYKIAESMRTAATTLEIPIVWGGAWDIVLTHTQASCSDIVAEYVSRRRSSGKTAFIDGPHYQLPWDVYPHP